MVEDTTTEASELARQPYPPISDSQFARLRPLLEAGGLPVTRAAAEHLAFTLQGATIFHERKRKPLPPQHRRRAGDPPRERLLKRRGAPPDTRTRRLFGALVSFCLDYFPRAPGVSYNEITREYYGPFVRFAQKVCAALAEDFKHRADADPGYLNNLQDVVNNPVRVRTWLDALTNLESRKKKPRKA